MTATMVRDDAGGLLSRDFFARDVVTVARALIGTTLLVDGVGGTIVETEAYDASDPASHCFGGRTARNASMFGPPGNAYVYRSYGLHWCLNFVCVPASGVLIRALEPTAGLARMIERRGTSEPRRLCAGPGRLCQALGIDIGLDGRSLDAPPFALAHGTRDGAVGAGPRIGISKAVDTPWRFWRDGSRFLSRPASGVASR
ncbi:DNA-3-methyladenine glycosylase [Sphingomonas sp. AR_OL41]|uniref:DNA-3-methyladenine glycosylase n=1 Tax=Sphingomonas sp. AR_OL41 TaxID=3042729 RepID=UPI0024819400|nr:DNA-3-methyladenine glycosylase [Sphingomonas sp. AR_OL41]MDH7973778.1 DNA-3-methyladenine glycosylase [Sphingomonas sp. AR_OL41]